MGWIAGYPCLAYKRQPKASVGLKLGEQPGDNAWKRRFVTHTGDVGSLLVIVHQSALLSRLTGFDTLGLEVVYDHLGEEGMAITADLDWM
jgi:hypothetical protein